MRAIKADGSDRHFQRTTFENKPAVTIKPSQTKTGISEARSFYNIGSHLFNAGLPVPKIYDFDPDTGTVTVEDLGDVLFYEKAVKLKKDGDAQALVLLYRHALTILDAFQNRGTDNFETSWCFDTPLYDSAFAFEREALYFMQEFLLESCGITPGTALEDELFSLCERVDNFQNGTCLMHRDFQSRNLMIKGEQIYIIDFQGARMGPFGYDPASLIFDPYLNLSGPIRAELIDFFITLYKKRKNTGTACILREFYTTALLRMLQALGAYSFLTLKRGRNFFKPFMKPAIDHADAILDTEYFPDMIHLKQLVSRLSKRFSGK